MAKYFIKFDLEIWIFWEKKKFNWFVIAEIDDNLNIVEFEERIDELVEDEIESKYKVNSYCYEYNDLLINKL
jgi:hypothetical protein